MAELTKHRILWCIDVFAKEPEPQIVKVLSTLQKQLQSEIEPVFAFTPPPDRLTLTYGEPWLVRYRPIVEEAFQNYLKAVHRLKLKPQKILIEPEASFRLAVDRLLEYARSQETDLIAVNTHSAQSPLRNWVMGSFTELLLNHSHCPILMVNPHVEPPDQIRHVVFSTDFSPASQRAFCRVLPLTKRLDACMTLIYKVSDPVDPLIQSGAYMLDAGWISTEAFLEQEREEQQRTAAVWQQQAQAHVRKIEVEIIEGPQSVAEAVVAFACNTPGSLIAMAAQTGPIASALLGSVTRQVAREARCPVWIIHES